MLQYRTHTVVFIPPFDVNFLCSAAPSSVSVSSIMKPCLAIYMQSRDKEKDIRWNESQFSGSSNWTEGCAGCGRVRLVFRGGKNYVHNSDTLIKTREPARALKSIKVKLMQREVYSSGLSGGHVIHMLSPAGCYEWRWQRTHLRRFNAQSEVCMCISITVSLCRIYNF